MIPCAQKQSNSKAFSGAGAYTLFEDVEFVEDKRPKADPVREPRKGAYHRLHPQRACVDMPMRSTMERG